MTIPQKIILAFIRLYQLFFSSLMGRSCRFYPTCSSYTAEAVRIHGALKGSAMGACRICRCHPFNKGGYDPVPPHGSKILPERFSFFSKKGGFCDKHTDTSHP